jgi:hypothetical protein
MKLTQAEYHLLSACLKPAQDRPTGDGVDSESPLHSEIWDYCSKRGWIANHGMMSKRTHRTKGEPDFVILAERGRVLFVECKKRDGKVSVDQQAYNHQAAGLGHTVYVVRSMGEFEDVVRVEMGR